jgi:membrane-bound lytic murein transglycosylase B
MTTILLAAVLLLPARAAAQELAVEPAVAELRAALRASAAAAAPAPGLMTPAALKARVEALLAGGPVPKSYAEAAFADPRTQVLDGIAAKFGRPAESLPYDKYRGLFITTTTVAGGAKFLADHAELLARVRARYGVDPALLTALVGVESRYGRGTGTIPVFDDLYTVALQVKPMSDWAVRELAAFLTETHAGGVDPHVPLGSYAGATGFVQFEPSSVLKWGVDFDGDGRVDLDTWPDALGSAANYLARNGYDAKAPFSPDSAIGRSIHAYNHSDDYVRVILDLRAEILKSADRP